MGAISTKSIVLDCIVCVVVTRRVVIAGLTTRPSNILHVQTEIVIVDYFSIVRNSIITGSFSRDSDSSRSWDSRLVCHLDSAVFGQVLDRSPCRGFGRLAHCDATKRDELTTTERRLRDD